MTFYFISDPHFHHNNIIRFGNRPFKNTEEMNKALVENWNNRVNNGDTIYILGDLFCRVREKSEVEEILPKLKGIKHLILGNHDRSWLKNYPEMEKYFEEITPYKMLHYTERVGENTENRRIVLCHFPILEWDGYYGGTYHIFVHIHNKLDDPQERYLRLQNRMFNAAVEINGYMPVTFSELVQNNKVFYNRN